MQVQILDWDNYLKLVDYIDNNQFKQEFWSPIALASWSCYGIKFAFNILENKKGVLFYIYNENHSSPTWKLTSCFYQDNVTFFDVIPMIKNDLNFLNHDHSNVIRYSLISENMIQDWKINFSIENKQIFTTNYVYYLDNFKTFGGKKLQKKRNHLNYFLTNYSGNVEIKNIQDVSDDDILNYCKEHILEYQNQENLNEMKTYEEFIRNQRKVSNKFKGIVIYINNKIEAITLCYTRTSVCEIIIEKASQTIRGLYQYLISQNLLFNNINQMYMDRQDDADSEQLRKSKLSYYPVYTIKRYSSDDEIVV